MQFTNYLKQAKLLRMTLSFISILSLLMGSFSLSFSTAYATNTTTGSINVCKVIIDDEGTIVDGSENTGEFTVDGIEVTGHPTVADSVGILPTSIFTTTLGHGLDLDTDLFDADQISDAQCTLYDGLALGGYFYDEEEIVGDNWETPLYNDGATMPLTSLDDFLPYSGELFTDDGGVDDGDRNTNADGHIVLTENRPDRTLVVLNEYSIPETSTITLYTDKIVCTDEADLPNWGDGKKDDDSAAQPITVDTASEWVAGHQTCTLEDWDFQWAPGGTDNPGDNTGEASTPWETFDGSVEIDLGSMTTIWVREVWNDVYIPFTGASSSDNESAELYCELDVLNYDNYDYINNLTEDTTYYCVGFNSPIPPANLLPTADVTAPTSVTLSDAVTIDGSGSADSDGTIVEYAWDFGDTNTLTTYSPASTTDYTYTATGTYVVTLVVTDDDGATSSPDTTTIIVTDGNNPIGDYCGDGIQNQTWEECDGTDTPDGMQCTSQCQIASDQCTEDVFARIVIDEANITNEGVGANMTSNIYLGQDSTAIPNETWFPVYYDGSYVNEGQSIEIYEDVPGLAVHRENGQITTRIYGTLNAQPQPEEHVRGYVEFYNSEVASVANDTSGNNKLEPTDWNIPHPDGEATTNAGRDYVWITSGGVEGNNIANFWLTVTVADDSFFTNFNTPESCELVCSDLEGQDGWYAEYFNYPASHIDMQAGNTQDGSSNLFDPLSGDWAADWYNANYYRFNLIDSDLLFGEDFFPLDATFEELYSGSGGDHEFHFGVHWSAMATVPTAGNYSITLTSDDDAWVYVDGVLVVDHGGLHAPSTSPITTIPLTAGNNVIDVYFAERHTTQSHMSLELDSEVILTPYSDVCVVNQPPVAVINASSTVLVGTAVNFDGASSTDDGTIISYDWDFMTGDTGTGTTTSYTFTATGTYDVVLTVTDNEGLTGSTTHSIAVVEDSPVNQAPTAIVTAPLQTVRGTSVTIDGSTSFDPDLGDTLTKYIWTFGDGGGVETTDSTTDHTYAATGTYEISLIVEDSHGAVSTLATTSIDVVVEAYAPYCGDGIADENNTNPNTNQEWEQCDGGHLLSGYDPTQNLGCSEQCQYIVPTQCTDLTLAQIDIYDTYKNVGDGSFEPDVYLGSKTNKIPSQAWFALYWTGWTDTSKTYELDTDIASYEDVPGLAVERQIGSVRTVLHGTMDDSNQRESVEGTVKFWNVEVDPTVDILKSVVEDSTNPLEGDDVHGDFDEPNMDWVAKTGTDTIFFQMSVNVGDDGFYAPYGDVHVCDYVNQPPVAVINASSTVLVGTAVNFDGASSTDDGTIISYDWDFMTGDTGTGTTTSYTFTATGTYDVILTVTDNEGLTGSTTHSIAVSETAPQCSDGIDNDGDQLIDTDDPTCHSDSDPDNPDSYTPEKDTELNTKPVITLIGTDPVTIIKGNSYTDDGATAEDAEDGDITGDIVTVGTSTVDTSTVGSYTITYNIDDSEGLSAEQVTRIVKVVNKSTPITPTCTNCGGGGGPIVTPIVIFNEEVTYLGNGIALVTWNTNVPATSQVLYGDNEVPSPTVPEDYGYDTNTTEYYNLVTSHSLAIPGLEEDINYFFRPISDNSNAVEVYGIELILDPGEVIIIPQCNYLLEYIHIGENNNPVEVRKLETFLNEFRDEKLVVNGIYEQLDFEAVERFQEKYLGEILGPWGHDAATGYVYITTKKKINEIYCQREFPLTAGQEIEIEGFRSTLTGTADAQELGGVGGTLEELDFEIGNRVGQAGDGTSDGNDSALALGKTDTNTEEVVPVDLNGDGEIDEEEILAAEEKAENLGQRNLATAVFGNIADFTTSWTGILLLAVLAVAILALILRKKRVNK